MMAKLLRAGSSKLVDHAIDRLLPGAAPDSAKTPGRKGVKSAPQSQKQPKRSLSGRIVNFMLMRVATRSVPGAIVVGAGLIAKRLHERHKAQLAAGKNPPTQKNA